MGDGALVTASCRAVCHSCAAVIPLHLYVAVSPLQRHGERQTEELQQSYKTDISPCVENRTLQTDRRQK